MFSGIVEEIGVVTDVESRLGGLRLQIQGSLAPQGTQIGDSIAVNGVCLTVVEIEGRLLSFEAVPETLRKTNLGRLTLGSPVNLERALAAGRPVGGHYVQGHVDTTVTVVGWEAEGDAVNCTFQTPPDLLRIIVPKGYVSVDGASLTVVSVEPTGFSVTLIPHTRLMTVLGRHGLGYTANLEVDILGKYIVQAFGDRLDHLQARLDAIETLLKKGSHGWQAQSSSL